MAYCRPARKRNYVYRLSYPDRICNRIVLPQFAVAVGSTLYGGRTSTIVAALIVGALGAFLSFKGYVPHA